MEYIAMSALVMVIGMLLTGFHFAVDWGRDRYLGNDGDIIRITGLKLTAGQAVKIKAMHENYIQNIKPLQDKMQSKREELRSFRLQKRPDQMQIAARQKKIMALREMLWERLFDYRAAVSGVLDGEQQRRLQGFLQFQEMGREVRKRKECRRGWEQLPPATNKSGVLKERHVI